MRRLVRLELTTWTRNKRLFLLALTFLAVALSATIMAYDIKDLMQTASTAGTTITMPDPTAASLIQSYMKTASQLGLFIACYLTSAASILERKGPRSTYYQTTAASRTRIYVPRLIVSLTLGLLTTACGAACAIYITWCYFDEIPFTRSIEALGVQLLSFLLFMMLADTIGILTGSAFAPALIVEGIVILSAYLDTFPTIHNWSPTTMLNPQAIMTGGFRWDDWQRPIIISLVTFGVCTAVLSLGFHLTNTKSHTNMQDGKRTAFMERV